MSTLLLEADVSGILVGAGDPPAADERRALGELTALVAAAAGRRADSTIILAGGMAEHLSAFGDVGVRRGEVVLGPAAQRGVAGRAAGRPAPRAGPAARRLAPGARGRCRRRWPRSSTGGSTSSRSATTAAPVGRPSPGVGGGPASLDLAVVPDGVPRAGRPGRRGRRPGRPVVDLGRRPASPARPDARAAHRAVGRCDRRRRDAPDGGRPGRARPARRGDPGVGRPAGGRPRRRHGRRLGRRARPRPSRSPSSTSCAGRGRPVRARPRPDPGAARVDPRPGRAPGDGARPRRRPARPARDVRHARPGCAPGRSAGSVVVHAGRGSTELDLMPGGLALVDLPPGTSGGRRVPLPRHGPPGRPGPALRDRRDRRARRASWSTCATCRSLPDRADLRGELLEAWQTSVVTGPRRMTAADVAPRAGPAARRPPRSTPSSRCRPGDRPLVAAGDSVVVGAPIAERLRDPRLDELVAPDDERAAARRPLGRPAAARRRARPRRRDAVLLARRWRVAAGDITDPIETPFAGIVRDVRPGIGITIRAAGRGIRGIVALGGPTRGRLHAGMEGELRSGGLDVGSAGTILVVGSRVDAETLTRARAMGVRGDRRRRPVEQGAARLPRLRGAPAGGAPPPAAVRGARPRRRHPAAAGRRRPGRARGAGRPRGGDRHRPADARVRPARPGHPGPAARPRPDPSRVTRRPRGPLRRGRSGRAGSPAASSSRPASSTFRTARPRPSRSATSSGSSRGSGRDRRIGPSFGYARPTMTAPTQLERRLVCPDPDATTALGRALAGAARGRAT